MIDINKLIEKNIEYSKKRLKETGVGKRNFSYVNPNISIWKEDLKTFGEEFNIGEEVDVYDFEDSHWLGHRIFYKEFGILVIYFNPITTNGKPPVLLGLIGAPITESFVGALDEGIYSNYYGYDNSSGAFYKKYIQQYEWINEIVSYKTEIKGKRRKDKYKGYIKNPTRVVDAVSLDDITNWEQKMTELEKSDEAQRKKLGIFLRLIRSDTISHYNGSRAERYMKDYMKKKLKDFSLKKLGSFSSKYGEKIASRIGMGKLLNMFKSTQASTKYLEAYLRRKGTVGLAKNISFATRNARRAGLLAAGEKGAALAPETFGLSLLIPLGISLTRQHKKNSSFMQKMIGSQGMGSTGLNMIKIHAIRKYIEQELQRELKREFVENGLRGLTGIKNLVNKNSNWNNPDIAWKGVWYKGKK